MKAGNLKLLLLTLLLNFKIVNLPAEQRIDLNVLQPTFEEDNEILDETPQDILSMKSKRKKELNSNTDSIIKLRALDKITAKTKDINIKIGNKERFGYLEIHPRKCNKFEDQNNEGVAAYIQVRDLSDNKKDKVFVFNGWTFSTSTNLKTFDHPIYDLWVMGCENI
tara:strand:- start:495 stop:992 length:498 start_codon:yes stop_codon:yes gene_type:complete